MINCHGIEKEVESFQGRSLTSQVKYSIIKQFDYFEWETEKVL